MLQSQPSGLDAPNRRTAVRSVGVATAIVILSLIVVPGAVAASDAGPAAANSSAETVANATDAGTIRWQTTATEDRYSTPTVHDGTAYVTNRNGTLVAVDTATGETEWRAAVGRHPSLKMAFGPETVVVCNRSAMVALDATNGHRRWTQAVDSLTIGPVLVNGTLWIGGDHTVSTFDLSTGERRSSVALGARITAVRSPGERVYVTTTTGLHAFDESGEVWSYSTDTWIRTHPDIANGTVVVGTDDTTVIGLNAKSGTVRWQTTLATGPASSIDVADGVAYVTETDALTSDEDHVTALDTSTGEQVWNRSFGGVSTYAVVVNHTVYVGSHSGMNALNAADGDREWFVATNATGGEGIESPRIDDGTVFVGPNGHDLLAIDATTGRIRWRFSRASYRRAMVANGTVFVGSGEVVGHHDEGLLAIDGRTGDVRWRWAETVPASITAAPTVVDGTVFVGSESGDLDAIDAATGERRWSFSTNGSIASAATVADETTFVCDDNGRLWAIAANGTLRWTTRIGVTGIETAPTYANGTLFVRAVQEGSDVTTVADTLIAVDSSGNRQWTTTLRTTGSIEQLSAPTVANGTVYLGSRDGTVRAIDAATGELRWQTDLGASIRASPTVAAGRVVVGTHAGRLFALDATTGAIDWRFDAGSLLDTTPTIADGTAVVGGRDGLYAVDLATGERRWTVGTETPIMAAPTVANGTVYAGSDAGRIYAIVGGERRWSVSVGGAIESAPTVVDGTLYVGSTDGGLYAIATGASASSEGSRVRLGTLGHVGDRETLPPIDGVVPRDRDGDGRHEDINANGKIGFPDVNAFFQHSDRPAVREHVAAYDFTDDGTISLQDVMALFRMV